MKIVHALGWYFPESLGGTEVYVAALCRRLRAAGHDISIVAPDPSGERSYEHDGVPVFRYPVPNVARRGEAQTLEPARGAERLGAWLRRARPDVFHVHSIVTGLGVFEIEEAHRLGARVVLTHHLPGFGYVCRAGTLLQWGKQPCDGVCQPAKCAACVLHTRGMSKGIAKVIAAIPPRRGRRFARVPGKPGTTLGMSASIASDQAAQQRLLASVDRMVTLNQLAKDILVANGASPSTIDVNRLGLTLDRPAPAKPRRTGKPVSFAFVGRFHRTKGVYEIARAIRRIPASVAFRFDLRGLASTDADREVRADIERMLSGDSRVIFGPPIDHRSVVDVLASYDVLCCPSIWFENGPTVAIEAMAAGTPVIGSRFGNFVELIADGVNGRLVAPGDDRDLASALTEIAEHPEMIDGWRRHLSPPRTMDDVAAEYLETYSLLYSAVA